MSISVENIRWLRVCAVNSCFSVLRLSYDAAFGLWALLKLCVICEDVFDFTWTMNNIFHVFFFFSFLFAAIRDGVKFENRSLVDQIERQQKVLVSSDQEWCEPRSRVVITRELRSRQRHRHVCIPLEPMFAAQRWIRSVSTNHFTSLGLDLTNLHTDINNVDSFQSIGAKLYLAFD